VYWGQIALSLAAALAGGTYLHDRGYQSVVVVLVGITVYIAVRWGIAWTFRTKFWYHHGGNRNDGDSCPNCGRYIYRFERDWVLRCGRCGWTAGWPVIRWFTKSVPSQQLRRTVAGPRLLLVVLAVSGLFAPAAVSGAVSDATDRVTPLVDSVESADETTPTERGSEKNRSRGEDRQDGVNPERRNKDQRSDESGEARPELDQEDTSNGFDERRVERLVLKSINEIRTERGKQSLRPLAVDSPVRTAARDHSEDMATRGYFSHTSPDGEGIGKRYSCTPSENIAMSYINTRVRTENGTEVYDSETELAEGLIQLWMNSDPHRKNLLREYESSGVGVYITESREVYATHVFCR